MTGLEAWEALRVWGKRGHSRWTQMHREFPGTAQELEALAQAGDPDAKLAIAELRSLPAMSSSEETARPDVSVLDWGVADERVTFAMLRRVFGVKRG